MGQDTLEATLNKDDYVEFGYVQRVKSAEERNMMSAGSTTIYTYTHSFIFSSPIHPITHLRSSSYLGETQH